MTTRLVDRNWGGALQQGRLLHSRELRIACPFIKTQPIVDLLGAMPPSPLEILTRFNLADFGSGVSDVSALRVILEAGGRVRGIRGLHAKLFLFGDGLAAVTSANLTKFGLSGSHEFGCVSDEPPFIESCRSYFDRLWRAAGPDLTLDQLIAWDAQLAAFLASGGRPDHHARLPDYGAIVSVDDTPPAAQDGWPAESGAAFVKFFGEGNSRRLHSDDVFDEVRRSGCHWACTYPRGRRPRQVSDGDTLFMGRLVRGPNDTLIFGRAIGFAYAPDQDNASAAEIRDRSWKARWPHYIRVHHAEFVAGPLSNGVRLSQLFDSLEADALLSTQRNRNQAVGNVNPRTAVRQHPAAQLTSEGAAWLTEHLEQAFEIHGRQPAEQLASLDWPTAYVRT